MSNSLEILRSGARSLFGLIRRTRRVDLHGRHPQQAVRIVLRVLTGRDTLAAVCRRHGITPQEFQTWREQFTQICRLALKSAGPLHLGSPVPHVPVAGTDEGLRMLKGRRSDNAGHWAGGKLTSGWRKNPRQTGQQTYDQGRSVS